jgi:hypothetical protein
MLRKTAWLAALVPAALVGSALALPRVVSNICPICGGGWDDYWEMARGLVSIPFAFARSLLGI